MLVNTNMKFFVSSVIFRNKGRWDKDQEMEEILQSLEKYIIADDSYVSVLDGGELSNDRVKDAIESQNIAKEESKHLISF